VTVTSVCAISVIITATRYSESVSAFAVIIYYRIYVLNLVQIGESKVDSATYLHSKCDNERTDGQTFHLHTVNL